MTVSDSVEIELKLALPPQQAAAFLKRMARRRSAPVQQTLITRYFDTPDFALSAQGRTPLAADAEDRGRAARRAVAARRV